MPSGRGVVAAVALAWAGMAAHDLAELPGLVPADPQFTIPSVLFALVAAAYVVRPGRAAAIAVLAWTGINLVGAVLTVLPLPFLPFEPEQSVPHYLAHVAYAATQIPALWVVARGRPDLRSPRTTRPYDSSM